jgi:hypothetical protein
MSENTNQTAASAASDRSAAKSAYSDCYKDVHNIRPRWMRWEGVSTEAIWEAVDALCPTDEEIAAWVAQDAADQAAWAAQEKADAEAEAAAVLAAAEAAEDLLMDTWEWRASRKSIARRQAA